MEEAGTGGAGEGHGTNPVLVCLLDHPVHIDAAARELSFQLVRGDEAIAWKNTDDDLIYIGVALCIMVAIADPSSQMIG